MAEDFIHSFECESFCQNNNLCSWISFDVSNARCFLFETCSTVNENKTEFKSSQKECFTLFR